MANETVFELTEPLDMHLHLRDADMLKLVGPLTSNTFSGALIMPNLVPPVTTKEALLSYKKRIIDKILKCIAGQELLINETHQTI